MFSSKTEKPILILVSTIVMNFGVESLMTLRLLSFSLFLIHLLPCV